MLWIEEKTKIKASTATHLLYPSATCLWGPAVRSKPFISTSKQRSRQGPPNRTPSPLCSSGSPCFYPTPLPNGLSSLSPLRAPGVESGPPN